MSNTPSKSENSKGRYFSQEKIAEIRNALAIILGNAQLLEREPEIIQEQRRRLKIIGAQTHRIASILEQGDSQDCDKKSLGGALKGLKEIKKILLEK